MLHLRLASIIGMALASLLPACAADEPPATREDVIAACFDYSEAACRTFGRCLGQSEAEIADCIESEQGGCDRELENYTCWDNQRDAYQRCSDIEGESCDSACGDDGFCFDYCPYSCPPPLPPERREAP